MPTLEADQIEMESIAYNTPLAKACKKFLAAGNLLSESRAKVSPPVASAMPCSSLVRKVVLTVTESILLESLLLRALTVICLPVNVPTPIV